jgi:hypothetical protein
MLVLKLFEEDRTHVSHALAATNIRPLLLPLHCQCNHHVNSILLLKVQYDSRV